MKHPILLLALLVSMGARLLQAAPAENVILVTADGHETMNTLPYDLLEIGG